MPHKDIAFPWMLSSILSQASGQDKGPVFKCAIDVSSLEITSNVPSPTL